MLNQRRAGRKGDRWGFGPRRLVARLAALLSLWSLVPYAGALPAADSVPMEMALRAAFLYRFAQFTTWPERPEPFTFCTAEDPEFARLFSALVADKRIGGASIRVIDITPEEAPDGCNVLYVRNRDALSEDDRETDDPAPFIRNSSGEPVLTVGDSERFAEEGGIIRFVRKGKRLGFEINLAGSRQARLTISSELLKLATVR